MVGTNCPQEGAVFGVSAETAAPTGGQDGPSNDARHRTDQGNVASNIRDTGSDTSIRPVAVDEEVTDAALEPGSANYIIKGEDKYLLRKDGSRIGPDAATECEMELWAFASKLRAEVERLTGERDRLQKSLTAITWCVVSENLKASEDTKS